MYFPAKFIKGELKIIIIFEYALTSYYRHYEYILQKESAYPSDIANPLQLLTRAIPLFSSFVLKNPKDKEGGYAPGARPRRQDYLEALYCDELCRCLFTLLQGGHMQSEWSGPD